MKKRLSLSRLSISGKLSRISENITSPVSPQDPAASAIKLLKTVTNAHPSQTPSPVEMQTISRATYGTRRDMQELLDTFLNKLSTDSPVITLKTLTVLTFVFKTGSESFYRTFTSSKGIWKLKSLVNYESRRKDLAENIRAKATELVTICEQPEYLELKKEEFRRLRTSFSQPTPRSSFDMAHGRTSFSSDGRRSQSNDLSPASREDILRELRLEDDTKPKIAQKESWHGRLRRLTNINEEDE